MRNFDDANHGLNAQIAELAGCCGASAWTAPAIGTPGRYATRGEVAQILWRLMQKIPTRTVLAYDNFEDPDSGWAENIYSDSAVGYVEGFYRIRISDRQISGPPHGGPAAFDDAYYEVWASPTPASGLGLRSRVSIPGHENLYELSV